MNTIYASPRLTRRYRDGWSYLDKFGRSTIVRLTPFRETDPGDPFEHSDGGTRVAFARLPARLTRKQRLWIARAVRDSISGSGCRHEYDCCGCATDRAYTDVKGRQLRVTLSTTFNY